MDATCKIQDSILVFSLVRKYVSRILGTYQLSPEPLSLSEIIRVMPTDKSIAAIYQKMNEKNRLEKSLSGWGDAIVWSDLHNYDKTFVEWD